MRPGWYPSKAETGKVVPTWNYAVVHAHGRIRFIEDRVWLRALVERLTNRHEAARPAPWAVGDAPVGKWKLSQNRPAADRAGVLRGLDAEASVGGAALASLMRRTFGDEPAS